MNDVQPVTTTPNEGMTPVVPSPETVEEVETVVSPTETPATDVPPEAPEKEEETPASA